MIDRAIFGAVWLLLASSVAQAQVGLSKQEIRDAQSALIDARYGSGPGYRLGAPDGAWNPDSAAALLDYQRDWELPDSGELTRDLLRRLTRAHPATRARWQPIEGGACRAWNAAPAARETAGWTGGCKQGEAEGAGRLEWRFMHGGEWRVSTYDGEMRAGRSHGRGVMTYASGDRYDGEWRQDKRHGRGVYDHADGGRYRGEWRDGERHGRGVYEYADGGRHEGEWRDGRRQGRGVLTSANGDRYEGEWRDDMRHGHGVQTSADAGRYEGQWRQDARHGQGVLTSASGNRFDGAWRDGKLHGRGAALYADGGRYEGEWRNGRPSGVGVGVTADGVTYSGVWRDGCYRDSEGRIATLARSPSECGL